MNQRFDMILLLSNVRGCGSLLRFRGPQKAPKLRLLDEMAGQLNPDLILLTETKKKLGEDYKSISKKYKTLKETRNQDPRGGVSILVKKDLDIRIKKVSRSEDILVVTLTVEDIKLTIHLMYGDSSSSDAISVIRYQSLMTIIRDHHRRFPDHLKVVAGDFNLNLSITVNNSKRQSYATLQQIIQEFSLRDAAKINQNHPLPTFYSPDPNKNASRIDGFFTPTNLDISYTLQPIIGDHHAILIEFGEKRHPRNHNIKEFILKSPEYLNDLETQLKSILIQESHEFLEQELTNQQLQNMNIEQLQNSLTFESTNLFNYIVNKAQNLHNIHLSRHYKKQRNQLQNATKKITNLEHRIHTEHITQETKQELKNRIKDIQEKLSEHMVDKNRNQENRIKEFYRQKDGKMTAITFAQYKPENNKTYVDKLKIEGGRIITQNEEIVNYMSERHKNNSNKTKINNETLEEYLRAREINMENNQPIPETRVSGWAGINPNIEEIAQEVDGEIGRNLHQNTQEEIQSAEETENVIENQEEEEITFSKEQVQEALKAAKINSCPGPSGQTGPFYILIFKLIPKIMTKFINSYCNKPEIQDSAPLAWIKKRKIIFIRKKGKEKTDPSSLRPLSLYETLFKLNTRLLTTLLKPHLNKSISVNQFGFMPGRSTTMASLSILHLIQDANERKLPLQLISLDAESAFDTMSPETIKQAMKILNIPDNLTDSIHNITSKGKASIHLNGIEKEPFFITNGIGQGDPPSAHRYIIGEEPLLRKLNQLIENYKYKLEDGSSTPVISFADDKALVLSVQNIGQLAEIFKLLDDYAGISGVKINTSKSHILYINTPDQLKREINQSQYNMKYSEPMTHLGIQLCSTMEDTINANHEQLRTKLKHGCANAQRFSNDIIKKALVVKTLLTSIPVHKFQVIPFKQVHHTEYNKIIREAVWGQGKRIKVAKNRINSSIQNGGLEIPDMQQMNHKLLSNTTIMAIHDALTPNGPLNIMEQTTKLILHRSNIDDISQLNHIGSKKLTQLANKLKRKSITLGAGMNTIALLSKTMESDPQTAAFMPISGNSNLNPINPITNITQTLLAEQGIRTTGQLYKTSTVDQLKFIDTQRIQEFENIHLNPQEIGTIRTFTGRIAGILRNNINKDNIQPQSTPIIGTWFKNREKISKIYRLLIIKPADDKHEGPPAYKTRREDRIPALITIKEFSSAYTYNMIIPTSTRNKSMNFEILNRTIWTNRKAYLSNMENEGKCDRCGQNEDTEHMFIECDKYPYPIWQHLERILQTVYRSQITRNQGRLGDMPKITRYQIMFLQKFNSLKENENLQIHSLVTTIKDVSTQTE